MKLTVSCQVVRGVGKDHCDDTALIGAAVINDDHAGIELNVPAYVCLCDGVGGNAGGREASLFVCSHMDRDLQALNRQLIEYGKQIGKPRMATTLTGLFFSGTGIRLMHAGNTRLYKMSGGFLNQMTTDHTTYEWLKSIGSTEAAEACNKSEIRCALGGGKAEYLKDLEEQELFSSRMPKLLLLTTDGVHDHLDMDEIEEIMTAELPDMEKIDRLIGRAHANGSADDCSVVIIRVTE